MNGKADIDDLGFARVDLQRRSRQGTAEVVYGEGKTAAQIAAILSSLRDHAQLPALVTRIDAEKAAEVAKSLGADFAYFPEARLGRFGGNRPCDGIGTIAVATGGTSDALGNRVVRLYDVGVAGLHRLLACIDELRAARVVIAVAGMEGALPSVIGGLVDSPVIAVPTSVGYGSSFGGVTALLAMLNSCAAGVSVVNIDNGFGAGFLASRINHMREAK